MKVTGVNAPRTPAVRRSEKKGAAAAGEFRKAMKRAEEAPADVGGVTGGASIGTVDSILAVQEVPDSTTGRANTRARQRGEALLDELDEIRHALLIGWVPRDQLDRLLKMVQVRRDTVEDLRLAQILDEIELRARVELAKFSREA